MDFDHSIVISKAEFSRLSKVPHYKVSRKIQKEWACILNGRKVMSKHPLAEWLIKNQGDDSKVPKNLKHYIGSVVARFDHEKNTKTRSYGAAGSTLLNLPTNKVSLESIMEMTLNEAVEMYGSAEGMKSFMQSVKLIEEVKEKRLKNMSKIGDLIPRSLVRTHVLGLLETLMRRLLQDVAKTVATRSRAAETTEAAIETTKKLISDAIKSSKNEVTKKLANIKNDRSISNTAGDPDEVDGE